MSRGRQTKEISFLQALYEEHGCRDADAYCVGKSLGFSSKVMKGMIRSLVRGNFIRKRDEQEVYLTEHGQRVIQECIQARG